MLKRILASSIAQMIVGRLLGAYMLFCGWTTRWTRINRRVVEENRAAGVVVCFWHGRLVLSHLGWATGKRGQPAKVLISQSREGGIAAAATETVGVGVIRGSSRKGDNRKGAHEATRQILRQLHAGGVIGIAPDGPRGPRMRAKMGAVQLARRTGAPIVCLAWSTSRGRVFNSWDRFILPYPFGRGVYIWSEPLRVPADADDKTMEAARAALEAELNRVTAMADLLAGATAVEPAPIERTPTPQTEPAAP
jgi:lysophospholipid acyltransferase (LPLAT)-like uncharacterized protein